MVVASGEGKGYPLYYSGLENSMDCVVHVVTKSRTRMSNFHYGGNIRDWEDPLERGMTTHFSILAWRIPWTEEPSGLQSTESQRVGHD